MLSHSPPEDASFWGDLRSALCHQGDVYDASFAAVPHIVAALSVDGGRASREFDYGALPVASELGPAGVASKCPRRFGLPTLKR